ncbi:DUF4832 domain-containing protein, partial [bacterium]|nr:DUF4832 domain-containing protein [bacterium]
MDITSSMRHLLHFIYLFALTTPAFSASISYIPSDEVILNPERGLAKFMVVGNSSIGDIEQLRADNHTIAWGIIRLGDYRATDALPESKLTEIKNWLAAVRRNRVKAVLRVAYHDENNFQANDATLSVQESHLTQLGSEAFVPYEDVIFALQAGGIGAYGEWYYTTSDLTTAESRKRLVDKMYEVAPDDTFVMIRTPYYKQEYEAAGALDDRIYRTGHYNDCFLSSEDDTGTYGCYPASSSCQSVTQLQDYTANDSNTVPVGGETCNASPRNDCPATLSAMEYYGYSFINTLWFSSIRSKWEAQGCFDDISKQLGYRYELISAELPDSISAGADVSVSVTLKNTGWAPMYHDRPVFIRLVDANGSEIQYNAVETDPRDWFAGDSTYTFTTTFQAAANLDTDSVSLSLWMPDSNAANYRVPEYSVRFANTDVWDSVNGDNLLATGIAVTPEVGGEVGGNECDSAFNLPSDRWVTLALPCQPPAGTSVGDLFSDDIVINGNPAEYGSNWIVYSYDAISSASPDYVNPGVDGSLSPGQGFWIYQNTGSPAQLDLPAGSVAASRDNPDSVNCTDPAGCVSIP